MLNGNDSSIFNGQISSFPSQGIVSDNLWSTTDDDSHLPGSNDFNNSSAISSNFRAPLIPINNNSGNSNYQSNVRPNDLSLQTSNSAIFQPINYTSNLGGSSNNFAFNTTNNNAKISIFPSSNISNSQTQFVSEKNATFNSTEQSSSANKIASAFNSTNSISNHNQLQQNIKVLSNNFDCAAFSSNYDNESQIEALVNRFDGWGSHTVEQDPPWNLNELSTVPSTTTASVAGDTPLLNTSRSAESNIWFNIPPNGVNVWEDYYDSHKPHRRIEPVGKKNSPVAQQHFTVNHPIGSYSNNSHPVLNTGSVSSRSHSTLPWEDIPTPNSAQHNRNVLMPVTTSFSKTNPPINNSSIFINQNHQIQPMFTSSGRTITGNSNNLIDQQNSSTRAVYLDRLKAMGYKTHLANEALIKTGVNWDKALSLLQATAQTSAESYTTNEMVSSPMGPNASRAVNRPAWDISNQKTNNIDQMSSIRNSILNLQQELYNLSEQEKRIVNFLNSNSHYRSGNLLYGAQGNSQFDAQVHQQDLNLRGIRSRQEMMSRQLATLQSHFNNQTSAITTSGNPDFAFGYSDTFSNKVIQQPASVSSNDHQFNTQNLVQRMDEMLHISSNQSSSSSNTTSLPPSINTVSVSTVSSTIPSSLSSINISSSLINEIPEFVPGQRWTGLKDDATPGFMSRGRGIFAVKTDHLERLTQSPIEFSDRHDDVSVEHANLNSNSESLTIPSGIVHNMNGYLDSNYPSSNNNSLRYMNGVSLGWILLQDFPTMPQYLDQLRSQLLFNFKLQLNFFYWHPEQRFVVFAVSDQSEACRILLPLQSQLPKTVRIKLISENEAISRLERLKKDYSNSGMFTNRDYFNNSSSSTTGANSMMCPNYMGISQITTQTDQPHYLFPPINNMINNYPGANMIPSGQAHKLASHYAPNQSNQINGAFY